MAEPATQNKGRNRGRVENLRPFEKGKSGNPGGRPKGLARATREILAGPNGDRVPEEVITRFWASVMADPKEPTHLRLRASELLADRGWGKAPEFAPIEVDPREHDLPLVGPRTRERLAALLEIAVAEPTVGAQVIELAARR